MLILFAFFILAVATGLVLARLFEPQVTAFIIKEVNKNLRTEISVGDVGFSLLKGFPDASVIFNDVLVKSVNKGNDRGMPDTLLSAGQIMLRFNLPDLIRNKYSLSDFKVNNGKINIYIGEIGNVNYQFWKEGRKTDTSVFVIDLEAVEFSGVQFVLDNRATQTYVNLYSRKAGMSGSFTQSGFELESRISATIREYSRNGVKYIRNKNLRLEARAERNAGAYVFSSKKLTVGNIDLVTEGQVSFNPNADIDMKVSGTRIGIPSVMEYFPGLAGKIPKGIGIDGRADVLLILSGKLNKTSMPHLEASYRVENGGVQFDKKKDRISGIILRGSYSNGNKNSGETSVLHVEELSAAYKNNRITGNLRLSDFTDPRLECRLSADIDLGEVPGLLKAGDLAMSGKASTNLRVSASGLRGFGFNKKDFGTFSYKGTVGIEDMSLTSGGYQAMDKVQATINVDKYLDLKEVTGIICNNNVSIKGRIDNWVDYFIEDKGSLWADLSLYGGNFSLDTALYCMGAVAGDPEAGSEQGNDANFVLKLKFWLDRFSYKKLEAENLRGSLDYRNGILTIRQAEGNTMQGYASAGASIRISGDRSMNIRSRMELNGIDIRELFRSFDNFSQDFIQDRHLRGKASGSIDFYGEFDPDLNIDLNSMLTDAVLTLENGELIDFKPLEQLSRFIDMEELRHIRFSRLKNEIFIRDGEVIIPEMDVSSSALNLSLSGDHAFNGYYNYKIRLSLSEILAAKFHAGRKNEEEFGYVEEGPQGRTNVYLSVTGTPDGVEVSYDRKAALGSLRKRMTDEKQSLKKIMKEEFRGNGDSLSGTIATGDSSRPFHIDWEERNKPAGGKDTLKNWKKESFILEFEEDTLAKGGKRK